MEDSCSSTIASSNKRRKNNNAYTFKVEGNIKPSKKLKQITPEEICNNFFKGECESSWDENKIFEILNFSFETGDENFSSAGNYAAIEGYRIAYLRHFPIVISPNIFWLMILQGFSRHMEIKENSKRLRNKFVDFEGKKNIAIETGINLFMASEDQWNLIIDKLLVETLKNIKINKKILEKLNKKFTTSTKEAEVANDITILSAFKQYFTYNLNGTCGVPEISIEGTIEDWKLLYKKILELGNLDEEIVFWTDELKKITKKIIETLETKKPDINFYKNIVQNNDRSRQCQPDIINGWIIKFIPYDNKGNKCDFKSSNFRGLTADQIPTQIVNLPFHLKNINKKGNIKQYDAEMYSGFFGVKQDEKTLSIKPIIGYVIVEVKDKIKMAQKELEIRMKAELALKERNEYNY